jgi:hypothetical protein
MSHKIIGFAHSSDAKLTAYVAKQLQAISNEYPDVVIEQADEDSELLYRYSSIPNRFPCFMILKNGACKNYVHAKYPTNELLNWVRLKIGF